MPFDNTPEALTSFDLFYLTTGPSQSESLFRDLNMADDDERLVFFTPPTPRETDEPSNNNQG